MPCSFGGVCMVITEPLLDGRNCTTVDCHVFLAKEPAVLLVGELLQRCGEVNGATQGPPACTREASHQF